jgi:hypothetical protein
MSSIEVFKTNVETAGEANNLVEMLKRHFPATRINFDLQDCDKILRVEGKDFSSNQVMLLLKENGFHCSILE